MAKHNKMIFPSQPTVFVRKATDAASMAAASVTSSGVMEPTTVATIQTNCPVTVSFSSPLRL